MIPEEAVEAAARAIYQGFHSSYKWEDAPDFEGGFRSISLKQARMAVEAATPHIAAQAWEAGRKQGFLGGWNPEYLPAPNPYRGQA